MIEPTTSSGWLEEMAATGVASLRQEDPQLYQALTEEGQRQDDTLVLVAASSAALPGALAAEGSVAVNVTAEGYPGARYHAGCEGVDQVEQLAIARAKAAFKAQYANVQPHSGSSANQAVLFSLLEPGGKLLGMELGAGGHLTHGAPASVAGRYFEAIGYGVDSQGLIDYGEVERLARQHSPRLIVCGTSAYARRVDFERFRAIADQVGAWLLADISHISGLVACGLHPSPIDHAHLTTTSTYKQLLGPRGGLILSGRDADRSLSELPPSFLGGKGSLAQMMQRAVFPYCQGTPNLGAVAAKAHVLGAIAGQPFQDYARRLKADAEALAKEFANRGYQLVSGGTDTHIVLIDLRPQGISGAIAEQALEQSGIIVNRNRLPGDTTSVRVTAGVRLGSNTVALRGLEPEQMADCAELVDRVLRAVRPRGDLEFELPAATRDAVLQQVRDLCRRFPVPGYPATRTMEAAV